LSAPCFALSIGHSGESQYPLALTVRADTILEPRSPRPLAARQGVGGAVVAWDAAAPFLFAANWRKAAQRLRCLIMHARAQCH
jgi:hypothetical protein